MFSQEYASIFMPESEIRSPNGKKILIIDDDPISLLIFTEMFKNEFNIYYATNSSVAMDMVCKINFDGYIIDLYLGDNELSGIELLGFIRSNAISTETSFVGITSSTNPQDQKKMQKAGFTHYCQKPLNKLEILQAFE